MSGFSQCNLVQKCLISKKIAIFANRKTSKGLGFWNKVIIVNCEWMTDGLEYLRCHQIAGKHFCSSVCQLPRDLNIFKTVLSIKSSSWQVMSIIRK